LYLISVFTFFTDRLILGQGNTCGSVKWECQSDATSWIFFFFFNK